MAQDGNLGLVRVYETESDDLSKEELQRRMADARDSISQTVEEIKDNVVHQYEAVKDTISETLDWREHFKKQPLTWSVSAAGAGFLAGYGIAAIIKGPGHGSNGSGHREHDLRSVNQQAYAVRPIRVTDTPTADAGRSETPEVESGPGLLQRVQETPVYHRVRSEAATVGNRFIDEVSKTAQEVLLPAAVGMIRGWLERVTRHEKQNSPRSVAPAN